MLGELLDCCDRPDQTNTGGLAENEQDRQTALAMLKMLDTTKRRAE